MLLDEHRSKALFREAGLPVPRGVLLSADERPAVPFDPPWVAKSQVLAGGRGKAGGVVAVERAEDLEPALDRLWGLRIGGKPTRLVRLEPRSDIDRELYLSFAVSRERGGLVLAVRGAGGVDVESADDSRTLVQDIDLPDGPSPHQVRAAFFALGLPPHMFRDFAALVGRLFEAVRDRGLLLAEINPLAVTPDGSFLCLDGKVEIDDASLAADPELERFFEPLHHTPEESEARAAGLAYVGLDGWVGLLANGAGLAMATMDTLNLAGLPAANFLDLGGAADVARMRRGLDLLFGDTRVRAVFINLYGGILSCADVARALQSALDGRAPEKPLVVRMAGNGAEEGRRLLADLDLKGIHPAETMPSALELLGNMGPRVQWNGPAPGAEDEANPGAALPVVLDTGERSQPDALRLTGETRVLVQGITGKVAAGHTRRMLDYGTNVVGGVTPFKGGQTVHGLPVHDSVEEAVREHDVELSVVFVPASFAPDAILEAARAGVPWVVCITEGVAQQEMLRLLPKLERLGTRLIGPNTPGVIAPGRAKAGIMPVDPFTPGRVAILSRSGTLTYEAAARLSRAGIGQSLALGIGGDPFVGGGFAEALDMLADDGETDAVLLLGEIGGRAEERLAEHVLRTGFAKPLAAFLAGVTAPPGRRLGHAGAILEESSGEVASKIHALRSAGVELCPDLESIPGVMAGLLE
ncbi:succinate--CoA ligase subunit alpha [Desulfohalovibrio reitneri]|uniref:succinate--CoA ligase subunit alpha n=1 Tax=Desulfohalovibrio reitneri TaxID=1307759 RepID=UPI0004A71CBB|nr:succinate--CoA ligase subunit alpha [Desulfohalovibrio reitneri]